MLLLQRIRSWSWSDTRPKPFKAKAFQGTNFTKAKGNKLNMTAAQAMAFALVLVPLLGPLLDVSQPNPVFASLALHACFACLLLRDAFSRGDLVFMQVLLLEHALLLKQVHPELAKRPKFHFTLHVVAEILRC